MYLASSLGFQFICSYSCDMFFGHFLVALSLSLTIVGISYYTVLCSQNNVESFLPLFSSAMGKEKSGDTTTGIARADSLSEKSFPSGETVRLFLSINSCFMVEFFSALSKIYAFRVFTSSWFT